MRLLFTTDSHKRPRVPVPFVKTLPLIARNQLRETIRYFRHQPNPLAWMLVGIFALVAAFSLVTAGLKFNRITILLGFYVPVAVFDDHLIGVLVSLFGIRFLFQRSPRFRLQPYLHLPLRRWQLVAYFQATSVFTIHNVYPLLFLVPFWISFILPYFGPVPSLYWLLAVVLCLVISTFLNNWVRSILTNSELLFVLLACLVWLLVAADSMLETNSLNHFSTFLFSALLNGDGVMMMLVGATALFVLVLSSFSLYNSLVAATYRPVPPRRPWVHLDRLLAHGPVSSLVLLELKMMWRNRRPRHYLIMSVLFSTAYLLFLLMDENTSSGAIFGAVIGLFASGGFALNYGQLMFGWESSFFDGLLGRNCKLADLIKAKFALLHISCTALFLFSLPIFVLLRPNLVPLHVAFLFYNMGVTCVLIMLLAIRNRRRVDIQKGGSFFNYEGFSAAHWFWLLPVAVPPTILLYILQADVTTSLIVISLVGLVSLLSMNLWISFFANRLAGDRYEMAVGFRAYGR